MRHLIAVAYDKVGTAEGNRTLERLETALAQA
jgi:hypothetical protein